MSRTLGQQRSAFALERVLGLPSETDKFDKLVQGLPAMILQNGFAQCLAFLLAKGTDKNGNPKKTDKHILVFDMLKDWLRERSLLKGNSRAEIMKEISRIPQSRYLQAQQEALAFLEWVKRYAKAGFNGQRGG